MRLNPIYEAQVQRSFDQPTIARELLREIGVTSVRDLAGIGLEKFDMVQIRKVLKDG